MISLKTNETYTINDTPKNRINARNNIIFVYDLYSLIRENGLFLRKKLHQFKSRHIYIHNITKHLIIILSQVVELP